MEYKYLHTRKKVCSKSHTTEEDEHQRLYEKLAHIYVLSYLSFSEKWGLWVL